MSEKRANVQPAATGQFNEAGRQLFTAYEQHDQSPVLAWLPILFGLLASAIVALAFCPVPRSQTVSGVRAMFLSVSYVAVTGGAGAFVLATCGIVAGRRRLEVSLRRMLPRFCGVAAWITPVVAFYKRDSLWAASTASVLGVFGSRLIYRHHLAIGEHEISLASAQPQIAQLSKSTNVVPTFAALLLQLAVLSAVASMARLASILVGSAALVISFFHQTATASNQSQSQSRSQNPLRFSVTAGLAVVFVGASLTPYLAVPTEGASPPHTGRSSAELSTAKPAAASANPKPGFLQSAGSFFRRALADNPPPRAQDRSVAAGSSPRPYPVLQALFGEVETANDSGPSSLEKKSNRNSTVIVADDSYSGLILRPEIKDDITIVAPLARRRVFDGRPNDRIADPLSIPFYGAYWFFRASDKTLPTDAVESHGDSASTSFRTTDFTPMSMEARQNFGSLIDLSCCRAIELIISNGDRRPGTVAVELILSNTRLSGKPRQSLGILPVNSTLRWFPGDNRPPVAEVLSFRLPAQSAMQSFDEAIVRFELKFPREQWSAKIAIEKFRLIPRGL
jgi:hypothetical protein